MLAKARIRFACWRAGVPRPDRIWLCEEASGSLGDASGSLAISENGEPGYQQGVTGWRGDDHR